MAAITHLSQLDLDKIYSYADYFSWKFSERIELIKGKIFPMSPAPSMIHQKVSLRLTLVIGNYFQNSKCNIFTAPFDVRFPINDVKDDKIFNVVQPDICVISDESKLDDRGCLGSPDLIVEILSPGNSSKELRNKYDLYLENEVKEYWIIHPSEQTLLIYVLENGEYKPSRLYSTEDIVSSPLFPELKVELESVFS